MRKTFLRSVGFAAEKLYGSTRAIRGLFSRRHHPDRSGGQYSSDLPHPKDSSAIIRCTQPMLECISEQFGHVRPQNKEAVCPLRPTASNSPWHVQSAEPPNNRARRPRKPAVSTTGTISRTDQAGANILVTGFPRGPRQSRPALLDVDQRVQFHEPQPREKMPKTKRKISRTTHSTPLSVSICGSQMMPSSWPLACLARYSPAMPSCEIFSSDTKRLSHPGWGVGTAGG